MLKCTQYKCLYNFIKISLTIRNDKYNDREVTVINERRIRR